MFNSLRGMVSGKSAENLYLLSGEIEWEIAMPASDLAELKINTDCRIFTWLYHREDQMKLYGFSGEAQRNIFLEMIKVEGIGPKGALKILGGISGDDLVKALEESDVARLETVPGLGKKTAAKMILSLKGKLVQAPSGGIKTVYTDLAEALTAMGYERRAASEALAKADAAVLKEMPPAEREKLLFKEAIVYLSGG